MARTEGDEQTPIPNNGNHELLRQVLKRPITLRAWLSHEQTTEYGIHVFDLGHPWVARLFGLPWLLVGGYATVGFISNVVKAPPPGYFSTSGWGIGVALLTGVFIPMLLVGIGLIFGFSRIAVEPDKNLIHKLWGVWRPLRHRQQSLRKNTAIGAGWTQRGRFYQAVLGSTVLARSRSEAVSQLYAQRAARRLSLPMGDRTALEMTQSLRERLSIAHAKRRYPKPGKSSKLRFSEDADGHTILAPPTGGTAASVAALAGVAAGVAYCGYLLLDMEDALFLWLPIMVLSGIAIYILREISRRLTATVITLGHNTISVSERIGSRTLRSKSFRTDELDDLTTKKVALPGHGPSGIALMSPLAMMRFGQNLSSADKSFLVRVLRHHIMGTLSEYPPIQNS